MLQLLETAHACGADVWKPGWTSDARRMCERRNIGPDHPQRAYYEQAYGWLAFPVEWHEEFRDRCHALGMQYAVSVYLPKDVWLVEPYADLLKVSSFENGDSALRRTCAATGKRTLISLGQMTIDQIDAAIYEARGPFHPPEDCLICTSEYPTTLRALCLPLVRRYRLGGLSDHSRNLNGGALAIAAGSHVVEAHYRLDTCHPSNPDFPVAFTPAEFAEYIRRIREAEEAMTGVGTFRTEAQVWALPYRVMS